MSRFQVILVSALVLLLSFAGTHPSAAQSSLPHWTEIEQNGAIPNPLWDSSSAYD